MALGSGGQSLILRSKPRGKILAGLASASQKVSLTAAGQAALGGTPAGVYKAVLREFQHIDKDTATAMRWCRGGMVAQHIARNVALMLCHAAGSSAGAGASALARVTQ